MANYVASIIASLGLDSRAFKAELAAAGKSVSAFGSTLAGVPGLGTFLGAAGLGVAVKGLVDYGAQVQHLSDRFQVSTDAIQKFGNAAEQNGVSMESVARGFQKVEVASARALGGNEELAQAFQRLGISSSDLKTLKPEDLMEKIGRSSMNAADLVKVLGRNGLELRPILRGLADGTIEYGKAIDSISIKRLEEADKQWKKIYETIRVLGAEALAKGGGSVAEDLRKSATATGASFGLLAGIGVGAWEAIKNAATGHFKDAKENLSGLASLLKSIATGGELKAFNEDFKKSLAPEDKSKAGALPKIQGEDAEETKLEEKRREKIEEEKLQNEVIRARLDHLDAIAKALETHLTFAKKIAEAQDKNNNALVDELRLQEKLTLEEQAQTIAAKNRERLQFSLTDLAEQGRHEVGFGGGPGHGVGDEAQRALNEEAAARRESLEGHFDAAQRHLDRADRIKEGLGQLKDSEKDLSGAVRLGMDAAKITEYLQAVVKNTETQIVVVGQ